MSNLILFDDESRDHLLPLTLMRPVAELRCGAFTIRRKWENALDIGASHITQEYLSEKYPIKIEEDNIVINGSALPNKRLVKLIKDLDFNEALLQDEDLIAVRLDAEQFDHLIKNEQIEQLVGFELKHTPVQRIRRVWDLLNLAGQQIEKDIEVIGDQIQFVSPDESNSIMGDRVYLEKGSDVRNCIINSESGPVYIASSATVMEGSILRGPLFVGPGSVIKMGARIYGPVSLGPFSKVGGELNTVVFQGYSNKGHDGFLGHSFIGEWCNLGADTNNSNLKNNYDEVRLWNYALQKFEHTGQQFLGLIMGDHSKAGINTMFNTGTVVGLSCNIFGAGFPRNFIPSFSWGGASGFSVYKLEKALETAQRMMARREVRLSEADARIFKHIFDSAGESEE